MINVLDMGKLIKLEFSLILLLRSQFKKVDGVIAVRRNFEDFGESRLNNFVSVGSED
jgi:hypothetical protein